MIQLIRGHDQAAFARQFLLIGQKPRCQCPCDAYGMPAWLYLFAGSSWFAVAEFLHQGNVKQFGDFQLFLQLIQGVPGIGFAGKRLFARNYSRPIEAASPAKAI